MLDLCVVYTGLDEGNMYSAGVGELRFSSLYLFIFSFTFWINTLITRILIIRIRNLTFSIIITLRVFFLVFLCWSGSQMQRSLALQNCTFQLVYVMTLRLVRITGGGIQETLWISCI